VVLGGEFAFPPHPKFGNCRALVKGRQARAGANFSGYNDY
jgi:hypothetical protein